jgi:hypothetical protein
MLSQSRRLFFERHLPGGGQEPNLPGGGAGGAPPARAPQGPNTSAAGAFTHTRSGH